MSLWDRIIEAREDATFSLPFVRNKYPLHDQGRHLRGLFANLTLYWNVMPVVGRLSTGQLTFPSALPMPDEYTSNKGGLNGGRASSRHG